MRKRHLKRETDTRHAGSSEETDQKQNQRVALSVTVSERRCQKEQRPAF